MSVVVTLWRCSSPPQVSTVTCRTFLERADVTTQWRSSQSVEDTTPGHLASLWQTGPGRHQQPCRRRGEFTDKYEHDGNYHVDTSHVSDDCPLLVSPIMIIIIRLWHSSWASPSGVILLGGGWSHGTSERIQDDGTSTGSFNLEYSLE